MIIQGTGISYNRTVTRNASTMQYLYVLKINTTIFGKKKHTGIVSRHHLEVSKTTLKQRDFILVNKKLSDNITILHMYIIPLVDIYNDKS